MFKQFRGGLLAAIIITFLIAFYVLVAALIGLGPVDASNEMTKLLAGQGLTATTIQVMAALSAPTALGAVWVSIHRADRNKRESLENRIRTATSIVAANLHSAITPYESVLSAMRERGEEKSEEKMPVDLAKKWVQGFVEIPSIYTLLGSDNTTLPREVIGTIILVLNAIEKSQYAFKVHLNAADLTKQTFYKELLKLQIVAIKSALDIMKLSTDSALEVGFENGNEPKFEEFQDLVVQHVSGTD